jgi:hypothetical protein
MSAKSLVTQWPPSDLSLLRCRLEPGLNAKRQDLRNNMDLREYDVRRHLIEVPGRRLR